MSTDDLLKLEVAFLVSLAQDNIAPDTQELLVHGNPLRGIKPGALGRALAGPLAEIRRLREEVMAAMVEFANLEAFARARVGDGLEIGPGAWKLGLVDIAEDAKRAGTRLRAALGRISGEKEA